MLSRILLSPMMHSETGGYLNSSAFIIFKEKNDEQRFQGDMDSGGFMA